MNYRTAETPYDVEHNVLCWLLRNGFPDAVLTAGGADGGVDVRATGLVVQVKAEWGKAIPREVIQQISGIAAYEQSRAAVFSWSRFTPQAQAWAEQAGVALFRILDRNGEVTPDNAPAAQLNPPLADNLDFLQPHPHFAELMQAGVSSRALLNLLVDGETAQRLGRPWPHQHLVGDPSACEETAKALAMAIRSGIRITHGQTCTEVGYMSALASSLVSGEVLYIQGPEHLNPAAEQVLTMAMEHFRVDVEVGSGRERVVIPLEVEPFTLITGSTMPSLRWRPSLFLH